MTLKTRCTEYQSCVSPIKSYRCICFYTFLLSCLGLAFLPLDAVRRHLKMRLFQAAATFINQMKNAYGAQSIHCINKCDKSETKLRFNTK